MERDGVCMEEYKKALAYWDELLGKQEAEKIVDRIAIEEGFDSILHEFSSRCKNILDYGCGDGTLSFMIAQNPLVESVIGTDTSKNGIEYANESAQLSGLEKAVFKVGGIEIIKEFKDNYFDGIIISNVLDVIPISVAYEILLELHRILKQDGLLFVKLNTYLNLGEENRFCLTKIEGNMYGKNGILRVHNCTSDEWRNWWKELFSEESYGEYPVLRKDVFDRVFLLKKK